MYTYNQANLVDTIIKANQVIESCLNQAHIKGARKYVNQYSYREVANWLTANSGRYISHVGLRKRLANERQRKNTAKSLRKWAEYAETAITKAKEIEEARTGARAAAAD